MRSSGKEGILNVFPAHAERCKTNWLVEKVVLHRQFTNIRDRQVDRHPYLSLQSC